MTKTFVMKLSQIQPTQLYISSEKLSKRMKTFNPGKPELIEPIPIKKLGNQTIFVDGHTRAFAAHLHNLTEVPVYWEEEKLDWDEYKICVGWCKKEGIRTIADLKNRVIPQKDYEVLWHQRCRKMQQDLAKRKKQTKNQNPSQKTPTTPEKPRKTKHKQRQSY